MTITIDEAIQDLRARIDGEFTYKHIDTCEDMKLGIEALKQIKWLHESHVLHDDELLPGETEK